jgi:hypothetical protein
VPVTDLVLSSAPIRGATLTLALLVLDPAGDRGEEVDAYWRELRRHVALWMLRRRRLAV